MYYKTRPFFKLKCEGLHPIHCLKQMFITFFHTFKAELGMNTRLNDINKFKISDFVISAKKILKSAIMGRQKTKKRLNKYSTFQSEQLPARHSLAGRLTQLSTEIPSTIFGSILPHSNHVAIQHYLDRTVLPRLLV